MAVLNLDVNGTPRQVDVDPATPLLYVLSDDLGLKGPKFGCGLGQCGACTVLVNGRATRSCITPVNTVVSGAANTATRDAAGRNEIVTLEGLGTPGRPHPIQRAFIDEQAVQCGFCLSGVILTAKALIDRNPRATDADVQQELSGVLCRCFVNLRFMKAIRRYADGRRA